MKDTNKYIALTKAVNNFTTRHRVDRGYFANILDYRGDNASIQFSNTLSPTSDKSFNSVREKLLIDALDMRAKRIYFDELLRPHNLVTSLLSCNVEDMANLDICIDDAMIEADEAFKVTKLALRDKVLDEDELRVIVKESDEAAAKYREASEMARARLNSMEEM